MRYYAAAAREDIYNWCVDTDAHPGWNPVFSAYGRSPEANDACTAAHLFTPTIATNTIV
jgi:hypothetical protein